MILAPACGLPAPFFVLSVTRFNMEFRKIATCITQTGNMLRQRDWIHLKAHRKDYLCVQGYIFWMTSSKVTRDQSLVGGSEIFTPPNVCLFLSLLAPIFFPAPSLCSPDIPHSLLLMTGFFGVTGIFSGVDFCEILEGVHLK